MSNFDAIFAACFDSSTLSSNLIEIALIFTSGHVFFNNAKTSVESTPLLRAIEVFVCTEFLIVLLMFELIKFSIICGEVSDGFSIKSFQVFLANFDFFVGLYLSVRIFLIELESNLDLDFSTT